MTDFQGARVRVGGSAGLAGGGVTSGELATAVADRAPSNAKYIVQEATSDLSAEQSLGALSTGILKNTTTAGVGVLSIAVGADLPSHSHTGVNVNIAFPLDGGGDTLDTGVWFPAGVMLPAATTIVGWVIDGDDDIVVTVQRSTTGASGSYTDISGTDKPTLSGTQTTNSSFVLTGWTTSLSQFHRLRISVDSATATYATINLLGTRTI
jgi:hypothetical protein